jgi:L-seryl-tRNA(Ser) seleniumtransferase
MRADKVLLAAIAATLALYRAGVAVREIPVWRQISASVADLDARATAIAASIGHGAQVVDTEATVGGGSLPGQVLPSRAVCAPSAAPDALLARLRAGSPAVVGRIERDAVILDLRSVEPGDDEALAAALTAALAAHG